MNENDFLKMLGAPPLPMPEPPQCVPLRILGLDHMPASKDIVRQAFRFKMFDAHPDVNPDALVADDDVQELVWARDWLLRKIPDPVTPEQVTRRTVDRRNTTQACPACKGERRNPISGEPYFQHWGRGRYYRYCVVCAQEADNTRQRDLRAQARADRTCGNPACGTVFTPARADGKFCSRACRQSTYRQRRQVVR